MTMGISATVRSSMLDKIRDKIDSVGSAAGFFRIYDGTRPATGGTATTLLAELTFSFPSAPNSSSGLLTFSAITADSSANNSGTATWGRMVDSGGGHVLDFSVGTSASDLNLNSVGITAGQQVSVSSATITAGNA